jgi:acetolactate synthase I/II/III large subunit
MPGKPASTQATAIRAAVLLETARNPLIIAGGGAADAAFEIQSIAEKLDAPVFMTINGKGILPPKHPLALMGNLGMEPMRRMLAEADVVLAVGTEFGETEMYPEPHNLKINGALIRIDIDPLQLTTALPATIPIAADSKLACAAIMESLEEKTTSRNGAQRAHRLRMEVDSILWPECHRHKRLLEIITEELPNAIIVGDQTEPVYASNQFYQAPYPRSYFNSSTGYGTLGYGLPAAFGARLGAPTRSVVCLIGDGGIQFSLQEIVSAVESGIAVVIIVWNNGGYGEIKNFMLQKHIPTIGVDLFAPDFVGLGRALGCAATRPENVEELQRDLCLSKTRNVPTLIELIADQWKLLE